MKEFATTRRTLLAAGAGVLAHQLVPTSQVSARRKRRSADQIPTGALDTAWCNVQLNDLAAVGITNCEVRYTEEMPPEFVLKTFMQPTKSGLERAGYVGGSFIKIFELDRWIDSDGTDRTRCSIVSTVFQVTPGTTAEAIWPVLEDGDDDLNGYGSWGDQSEISYIAYPVGNIESHCWDLSIRKGPLLSSISIEVHPEYMTKDEVLDCLTQLGPVMERKMDESIAGKTPGFQQRIPQFGSPGNIYYSAYQMVEGTDIRLVLAAEDEATSIREAEIVELGQNSHFLRNYTIDVGLDAYTSPYKVGMAMRGFNSEEQAAAFGADSALLIRDQPELEEVSGVKEREITVAGEKYMISGASWKTNQTEDKAETYTIRESITSGTTVLEVWLDSLVEYPETDLTALFEELIASFHSEGSHTLRSAWPAEIVEEATKHIESWS